LVEEAFLPPRIGQLHMVEQDDFLRSEATAWDWVVKVLRHPRPRCQQMHPAEKVGWEPKCAA